MVRVWNEGRVMGARDEEEGIGVVLLDGEGMVVVIAGTAGLTASRLVGNCFE